MIVYHGANLAVEQPDTKHSNKCLDFGPGFYVTKYKDQAEKWSKRKAMRYGGNAVVSMYELCEEELNEFRYIDFFEKDEEWLDFVCACRRGEDIYQMYDVVSGNVADDDVFKSVDMYFRGLWDKARTLEEIRYYKENHQIAFLNQNAIHAALKYIDSYKAGE